MCHKTIILPAVLCGSQSRPLVLKEEYGFWFVDNRVRKIFGHKGGGHNRRTEKIHNEELRSLHSDHTLNRTIRLRRIKWAQHVVCMERWELHTKKREEKNQLEYLDTESIILKFTLNMYKGGFSWIGTDFSSRMSWNQQRAFIFLVRRDNFFSNSEIVSFSRKTPQRTLS
jgi:hypothetical protein